jgi:hypothetical protein
MLNLCEQLNMICIMHEHDIIIYSYIYVYYDWMCLYVNLCMRLYVIFDCVCTCMQIITIYDFRTLIFEGVSATVLVQKSLLTLLYERNWRDY